MTNELEDFGPGSYITELASGGPKNYAYKVFSPEQKDEIMVCKVKGISLTYDVSKLINFETLKNMVLQNIEPVFITTKNFRRTKEHNVITKKEIKIYKTNSTKRKFFEDHTSLPYGYKKLKTS